MDNDVIKKRRVKMAKWREEGPGGKGVSAGWVHANGKSKMGKEKLGEKPSISGLGRPVEAAGRLFTLPTCSLPPPVARAAWP
jgi:hypothetical protein